MPKDQEPDVQGESQDQDAPPTTDDSLRITAKHRVWPALIVGILLVTFVGALVYSGYAYGRQTVPIPASDAPSVSSSASQAPVKVPAPSPVPTAAALPSDVIELMKEMKSELSAARKTLEVVSEERELHREYVDYYAVCATLDASFAQAKLKEATENVEQWRKAHGESVKTWNQFLKDVGSSLNHALAPRPSALIVIVAQPESRTRFDFSFNGRLRSVCSDIVVQASKGLRLANPPLQRLEIVQWQNGKLRPLLPANTPPDQDEEVQSRNQQPLPDGTGVNLSSPDLPDQIFSRVTTNKISRCVLLVPADLDAPPLTDATGRAWATVAERASVDVVLVDVSAVQKSNPMNPQEKNWVRGDYVPGRGWLEFTVKHRGVRAGALWFGDNEFRTSADILKRLIGLP